MSNIEIEGLDELLITVPGKFKKKKLCIVLITMSYSPSHLQVSWYSR